MCTTLDTDSLLADCLKLALQVAPELAIRPLYICSASIFDDLPGLNKPRDVSAWAFGGFDVGMKDRIPGWRGPGPVVALNLPTISQEVHPDFFPDAVRNVTLHEVAHLLPVTPPEDFPTRDYSTVFDDDTLRKLHDKRRVLAEALPTPTPGSEHDIHGAAFVRTAIHLLGRSHLAGYQLCGFDLFGGALWFICQPAHWLAILLQEIVEMRDAPFSTILATSPPAEFTELWDRSLSTYLSRFDKEPKK